MSGEMTRADRAHEIARSAYDAAMKELSKAGDMGVMLAATVKCSSWLLGEYNATVALMDGETAKRYVIEKAVKR